jgi:hypothetical protein
VPKASQAENKRDSDSIINRLTDHQNSRLSEKQRADISVTESKRGAIQKIHRKIQKNFAEI